MKNQKELKAMYKNILTTEIWSDQSMVDYSVKNCAYVVELVNGNIITIDKPTIKKDFCFGYSNDSESFDNANDMARHASENKQYFIDKNLESLNRTLKQLRNGFDGSYDYYIYPQIYSGQKGNSKLNGIAVKHTWEVDDRLPNVKKLSDENRERVIKGYEEVKAKFEKRLNTYLKRYGLSKLNTWSYWRDA